MAKTKLAELLFVTLQFSTSSDIVNTVISRSPESTDKAIWNDFDNVVKKVGNVFAKFECGTPHLSTVVHHSKKNKCRRLMLKESTKQNGMIDNVSFNLPDGYH
jgi:hypothetical protein